MRIVKFRRLTAALMAVVMLLGILAGCDEQTADTLSEILEYLYATPTDIATNTDIEVTEADLPEPDTENLPESGITLEELMAQLNEERQKDVRTVISDSSVYLPDYESEEFLSIEFSEEEIELLTTPSYEDNSVLDYMEAENDVDYLFRLLKTSYAPYEYFGGDEVFDRAKADILSDLAEKGNSIQDFELVEIITENLEFMTDSHFSLEYTGIEFAEELYYYDTDKREFRVDEKGYYTVMEGVRYYVDKEYEQYLKLTVGESGELVYAFIMLCPEGDFNARPEYVSLHGEDGREIGINLSWWCDNYNYATYLTWEDEVEGIPLTGIGAMMVDDEYYIAEMNDFVNNAKELRNEEVFILDLRGNMGGLSTISYMWLYNLTGGCEVEGEYSMVYYMSMLNDFVTQGNNDEAIDALLKFDFFEENPDLRDELLSEENEDEYGEGYVYDTIDSWNEYDGTVIVLCDKAVSSAGEMFILELMDLENVVVFGTNSNGCLISGGTNYYVDVYLPNSGISVYYSTVLILTDDSQRFDARGVQPDVVICGEDEAEAAARCWNYYNNTAE